jgi:hypothetical protein
MIDLYKANSQIKCVTNFYDLVAIPFQDEINAIGWTRNLVGDFSEIVNKIALTENLMVLNEEELCELNLTEQGELARNIILHDLALLRAHGASPTLNLIKYYERDDADSIFSTDVYSFHVDSSPIPTETFLCTYYGESSQIIPNSQVQQKVLIPEIRSELKKLYSGAEEGFESFLSKHFFDLHYQAMPHAQPISLGIGNIWRLATQHPESKVQPCVHRAPKEKTGENRLLMIC